MIQNNVYAFGGVIGPVQSVNTDYLSQQNVLVDQQSFKLVLTANVPKHYFHLTQSSFLWTGGSKEIDQYKDFDYSTEDSKFVFVKFNDSECTIISDHYSKIPLLYIQKGDALFFATSLPFLLRLSNSGTLDINYDGLSVYYHFGVNSFEQSLIKNLKVLSGGSQLTYANKQMTLGKYFDLTTFDSNWKNTDTVETNTKAIDQVLLRSTAKTIKNYKTVGIAVSGGVDSGYLAQKLHECNREFKAYTIGYVDGYNEFERIDYLAKILNFKAEKIIISAKEILDNYIKVSAYSSFPLGYNNSIMNFVYERAASDGVEVLFDGDGADRLFLGMNKFTQLQKFLKFYDSTKALKLNRVVPSLLQLVNHPSGKKLQFYFRKLNHGMQFYGERILLDDLKFDLEFEEALNDLMLPKELRQLDKNTDKWLFFSLFSIYYTPTFFFHTPYELQLKHGLVSNPEFWSDEMVQLSLSIPTKQKLYQKKTKFVLREAAKLKIDDGYWNMKKIGLQNSYKYLQTKDAGKDFINSYVDMIKKTDEYAYLKEHNAHAAIEADRLIPYYLWKEQMFK